MSLLIVAKKKLAGVSFAERLREAREAESLTQAALAEAAGLNRVNLNQYERGKVIPSFKIVCQLAEALGREVGELQGTFPEE